MEAAGFSETSVNLNQTCRGNRKSHTNNEWMGTKFLKPVKTGITWTFFAVCNQEQKKGTNPEEDRPATRIRTIPPRHPVPATRCRGWSVHTGIQGTAPVAVPEFLVRAESPSWTGRVPLLSRGYVPLATPRAHWNHSVHWVRQRNFMKTTTF
jgi:hypothetical protein